MSNSWHVWWIPPTHWREEGASPGFPPIVIVVRPDVSLSWIPTLDTLYTSEPAPAVTGLPNRLRRLVRRMRDRKSPFDSMSPATIPDRVAELPLTNPRLPAAEWELTTLGQEEYLGHAVRRVRATRRPAALRAASAFGSGSSWIYFQCGGLDLASRPDGTLCLQNGMRKMTSSLVVESDRRTANFRTGESPQQAIRRVGSPS